jgi:hypothetical protein
MYGKRQTLPRPMAQPAETRIKPSRLENVSLFLSVAKNFYPLSDLVNQVAAEKHAEHDEGQHVG